MNAGVRMTAHVLMITFRVWLLEIPVAAFNAFVLMDRVYKPRAGPLRAHQIAMGTRIAYLFAFAYFLVYFARDYSAVSLIYAGLFWMGLMLAFEWGGSLLIRRPVHEILIGWHIERGYMWSYVLLTYLLSPLIVGWLLHTGRRVL
jgi:hypothetical protein